MQGDVIGIVDNNGIKVVEYTYDEWGKLLATTGTLATTIGTLNPIRYRGYYYDTETGFYYCQSRYYDPEISHWISPEHNIYNGKFDFGGGLIGYNTYVYCANNPINNIDNNGEAVSNIVGGIVGGVTGAALGYILADALGLTGWKKATLITVSIVGGAALGAFLGPYVSKLSSKVLSKLGLKEITKQTIKMSRDELWKGSARHIFSNQHIRDGIMKLGGSQKSIFNKLYRVVNSYLPSAVEGSNQIHATINGVQVTIRFFVSNGQVQSINAFTGWATRIIGTLL